MRLTTGTRIIIVSAIAFCTSLGVRAQSPQSSSTMSQPESSRGVWTIPNAEHLDGLPEIKPNKKGTLTLTSEVLKFSGKNFETSIPRGSVTSISAGNERVEMLGTTGKLLRPAIPDGGGLAVAAFAHHQVDLLTVEFNDSRGGNHAAMFFLQKDQAMQAVNSFDLSLKPVRHIETSRCENGAIDLQSVLIVAPNWDNAQVPEAYRGLVYEHVIERFQKAKDIKHVYRDGEMLQQGACPQYTLKLSVTAFKEGNSVKRAALGPVGMFVGTTQMVFNANLQDRTGVVSVQEEVKATVRGDSESTGVANTVAKTVVKKFEAAVKKSKKSGNASSRS